MMSIQTKSQDKSYTFHEAANEFPLLEGKRFNELAEDIQRHGLREPIMLCDDRILDGRNRYRACLKANITPRFVQFDGGDPYAYVWSLNGERRDLTADQRYLVWRAVTDKSEAWQKRQAQIQAEGNRKRSKAQMGNQNAAKSRPKNSAPTTSGQTVDYGRSKSAKEKAKASKTNRGTVERMDRLDKERPDLAKKVQLGKLKPAEAMRQMKKDQVAEKVTALPADKYRVIYADPPWKYGDSRLNLGTATGAEHHYPTMTISELSALPIRELCAENAVLFLWATSPLLEDAFKVINAWGFKYKASFVWHKLKHNLGHYNSVRHEFLLIATKGSCLPDVSRLHPSVVDLERAKHSEKPELFREIIDGIYPKGKRIELFRRGAAPAGWEVWGNESSTKAITA